MPTGLMDRLPPPGLTPRKLVQRVGDDIGVDLLRSWCVDLLRGEASAEDDRYPHIGWLGGTTGWLAYWARVWGARGLLHAGPPDDPAPVLAGLEDEAWRVREMVLKVITRYELDDPAGRIAGLTQDPVGRVRWQAWRALGVPPFARATRGHG